LAFTLKERLSLGIHGLQPPRFKTQEEQLALCKASVMKYSEDLNRYLYLVELQVKSVQASSLLVARVRWCLIGRRFQERNERLFFRLLSENIEQMMPIVYTPTVGLACQKFGVIYRRPRGLFITIYDKGHIYDVLNNWLVSETGIERRFLETIGYAQRALVETVLSRIVVQWSN